MSYMSPLPMIKELFAPPSETNSLRLAAAEMQAWNLTARQICDVELLLNGGFAPLTGFMGEKDYESVLRDMRMRDGSLFPLPICLDVSQDFASRIAIGDTIALRDGEGVILATMDIADKWIPDKEKESISAFGTSDTAHPGVRALLHTSENIYIGGRLTGLEAPNHYDFREFRHSPNELRQIFNDKKWQKIVGFQTRNPLHRAHYAMTLRAAQEIDGNLLLHPVVGMTKPGDVDHYTRVRCYQAIADEYPKGLMMMSLLPLAMRMAGPKEALWHALIRKNYGCSHFIIGRDHAGPGKNAQGDNFYDTYAAQELVQAHAAEIAMTIIPFREMLFVEKASATKGRATPEKAHEGCYLPADEVKAGDTTRDISGTELRRRLREGEDIPTWFSYAAVIKELRRTFPPRHEQGFTLFFTGLSGAGKSTIAGAVLAKLMALGDRPITLLDGDIVRKHLSSELGFSRSHRDLNVTRIGFVASEITKNHGIAICAPIAPYGSARERVRHMIEPYGVFLEIFVDTPLAECERRDRKGLYRLARSGRLKNFTGIDDPYEKPENPDIVLTTMDSSADECAEKIIAKLRHMRLILK